ncbi:hypothetical protein OGAPHI_002166 [Ogataea philodendri]|uniref:Uncharacterized protein n=1 Tax=Ogataea philodendri TaxID=1378263 RepID=A0A9P8PBR7_9ASCO|nr:uncharacterized protein OGAPHI_002166 [Ogataea philodendri]KAH3668412.1 hypothetical protein OGAPHI_002166 [Ogataea philodendri]
MFTSTRIVIITTFADSEVSPTLISSNSVSIGGVISTIDRRMSNPSNFDAGSQVLMILPAKTASSFFGSSSFENCKYSVWGRIPVFLYAGSWYGSDEAAPCWPRVAPSVLDRMNSTTCGAYDAGRSLSSRNWSATVWGLSLTFGGRAHHFPNFPPPGVPPLVHLGGADLCADEFCLAWHGAFGLESVPWLDGLINVVDAVVDGGVLQFCLKLVEQLASSHTRPGPRKNTHFRVARAGHDVAVGKHNHLPDSDTRQRDCLDKVPCRAPHPHGSVLARTDQLARRKHRQRVHKVLVSTQSLQQLALVAPYFDGGVVRARNNGFVVQNQHVTHHVGVGGPLARLLVAVPGSDGPICPTRDKLVLRDDLNTPDGAFVALEVVHHGAVLVPDLGCAVPGPGNDEAVFRGQGAHVCVVAHQNIRRVDPIETGVDERQVHESIVPAADNVLLGPGLISGQTVDKLGGLEVDRGVCPRSRVNSSPNTHGGVSGPRNNGVLVGRTQCTNVVLMAR